MALVRKPAAQIALAITIGTALFPQLGTSPHLRPNDRNRVSISSNHLITTEKPNENT